MKSFVGSYGYCHCIAYIVHPSDHFSTYLYELSEWCQDESLRPEIAKLKEKHGKDQQAMSMEQMKLFREAGCQSVGRLYPGIIADPDLLCLVQFL